MNIFADYVKPSTESDEGTLTTQDEFQGFDDINNEEVGTKGLPVDQDPVIQDASGEDKAIEGFGGAIKEIDDCKASLEATYEILSGIHNSGRTTLTDHEHAFTQLVLNQAAAKIGTTGAGLVPSVESDNYFESHDIMASMEGLGGSIKAAGKAAWEMFLKLLGKVRDWFKNQWGKVDRLANRIKGLVGNIRNDKEYVLLYPKLGGGGNPQTFIGNAQKAINYLKNYKQASGGALTGRGVEKANNEVLKVTNDGTTQPEFMQLFIDYLNNGSSGDGETKGNSGALSSYGNTKARGSDVVKLLNEAHKILTDVKILKFDKHMDDMIAKTEQASREAMKVIGHEENDDAIQMGLDMVKASIKPVRDMAAGLLRACSYVSIQDHKKGTDSDKTDNTRTN